MRSAEGRPAPAWLARRTAPAPGPHPDPRSAQPNTQTRASPSRPAPPDPPPCARSSSLSCPPRPDKTRRALARPWLARQHRAWNAVPTEWPGHRADESAIRSQGRPGHAQACEHEERPEHHHSHGVPGSPDRYRSERRQRRPEGGHEQIAHPLRLDDERATDVAPVARPAPAHTTELHEHGASHDAVAPAALVVPGKQLVCLVRRASPHPSPRRKHRRRRSRRQAADQPHPGLAIPHRCQQVALPLDELGDGHAPKTRPDPDDQPRREPTDCDAVQQQTHRPPARDSAGHPDQERHRGRDPQPEPQVLHGVPSMRQHRVGAGSAGFLVEVREARRFDGVQHRGYEGTATNMGA